MPTEPSPAATPVLYSAQAVLNAVKREQRRAAANALMAEQLGVEANPARDDPKPSAAKTVDETCMEAMAKPKGTAAHAIALR